jgi:hypothetical protein
MARRNAFIDLQKSTQNTNLSTEDPFKSSSLGTQTLDLIPVAQPRKKRNRGWEMAHRAETATYRGVPIEYHHWLTTIAENLSVPRDEVVRKFLEYGIEQYQSGRLLFYARPKAQRMTLFPKEGKNAQPSSTATSQRVWLNQAFPLVNPNAKRASNQKGRDIPSPDPRWKSRVTYRIPVDVKQSIRSIAEEHTLPVGEVVWFFFEQARKAMQDGKLNLKAAPKFSGQTLFDE